MDDTEPKPDQPAEPVDESGVGDAAEDEAAVQHRRDALADFLGQIELPGQPQR